MKLTASAIFMLILGNCCYAQGSKADTTRSNILASFNGNISITAGPSWIPSKNAAEFLNAGQAFLGLDAEHTVNISRGDFYFDSRFSFHFISPQAIVQSDAYPELSGMKISALPVGQDLFYAQEHFDLVMAAGLTFGQLKYRITEGEVIKNGFTLAEVSLQARYVTKLMTFSIRPFFGYDFSKYKWKGDTDRIKAKNSNLSMAGIAFSLGVTLY